MLWTCQGISISASAPSALRKVRRTASSSGTGRSHAGRAVRVEIARASRAAGWAPSVVSARARTASRQGTSFHRSIRAPAAKPFSKSPFAATTTR